MQCGRGRAYEMYIQTPSVRGPGQEALSKKGDPFPPGWEWGSKAISKGCVSLEGGNSCHSCLYFFQPKLEGVLNKRTGSQKPRCQHPILDLKRPEKSLHKISSDRGDGQRHKV